MSFQIYLSINRNQLHSIVEKQNISLIVFLNAKWCNPCKQIKPYIYSKLQLLKDYPQIMFADIDIDNPENRDLYSFLKSKKQLTGVPTLLYFTDSIYSELCISGNNKIGVDAFFTKILQ